MDVPVNFIKLDYIGLVRKHLPYHKDMSKLSNVEFVLNPKLGKGANSDLAENIIEYGPYADEVTIFHELEHIRKGPLVRTNEEDIRINDRGELKIATPRYGIFLDEAITECVATCLFQLSQYYQPQVDKTKLESRDFYRTNVSVLGDLSKTLDMAPMALCKLIELKHHKNDNTIDRVFNRVIEGVSFTQFEEWLDRYETAHYIDYQCEIGGMPANGCSRETKKEAEQCLTKANNAMNMQSQTNKSNTRAW